MTNSDLLDIHENIDWPIRRATGVLDLIITNPDADDCVKTAAEGAAHWLREAKDAVDYLHVWAIEYR